MNAMDRKIIVRQNPLVLKGGRLWRLVEADNQQIGWVSSTDGIYRFISEGDGYERYFPTIRHMRQALSRAGLIRSHEKAPQDHS